MAAGAKLSGAKLICIGAMLSGAKLIKTLIREIKIIRAIKLIWSQSVKVVY